MVTLYLISFIIKGMLNKYEYIFIWIGVDWINTILCELIFSILSFVEIYGLIFEFVCSDLSILLVNIVG